MRSRFAARGRYSWQEETHVQFNRWLVQRYRAHWPSRMRAVGESSGTGTAGAGGGGAATGKRAAGKKVRAS
jgi:hypothetical protein